MTNLSNSDNGEYSHTSAYGVGWSALRVLTVTPMLRWLISHHAVNPGEPWRRGCRVCGASLWPRSCGPRGRCDSCGARHGAPPWTVESALVLGLIVVVLSPVAGWALAAYAWWAAVGVVLAFVDALVRRLPNRLVAGSLLGFAALLGVHAVLGGDAAALGRAAAAAAAVGAAFALLAISSSLGWGDVKFSCCVGAALGWFGLGAVLAGLFLAFTTAAVVEFGRGLAGREKLRSVRLPLGVYLVVGTLATLPLVG